MFERPCQVEVAKGLLGRLEMPHHGFAQRLAKPALAPPLVDPGVSLADRAIPLERRPAMPAPRGTGLRATGLNSVTPAQCRQRSTLNLAAPLAWACVRRQEVYPQAARRSRCSSVTPDRRQIRPIRRSARSEEMPTAAASSISAARVPGSSRLSPLSANAARPSNDSSASWANVRSYRAACLGRAQVRLRRA